MKQLKAFNEITSFWTETVSAATTAWLDAVRSNPLYRNDGSSLPSKCGERERPASGSVSKNIGLRQDWNSSRSAYERDNLEVGSTVRFSKTFTEEDISRFAMASGDTNPLHLDEEYAEETRFGRRISHGVLANGLISAALARLPGDVIYMSNTSNFLAPVPLNERMTAVCEVVEEIDEYQFRLETYVQDEEGDRLVEGEATLLVDEIPQEHKKLRKDYLATGEDENGTSEAAGDSPE